MRNFLLAMWDQRPLGRFLRNVANGNILGLFSKRSHINANGKPKVRYTRRITAEKAAADMQSKHGGRFSVYRCIYCGGYHLGKTRFTQQHKKGPS